MLGEGYDHSFLSIAAIFRPYRSLLPYTQFIGRILRTIETTDEYTPTPNDNVGQIVSHDNLYLHDLWDKYKLEIKESELIKSLDDIDLDIVDGCLSSSIDSKNSYDTSIGIASEEGEGKLTTETYLDTDLLKLRDLEIEKENQKVKELQAVLNIDEEEARRLYLISKSNSQDEFKRPDLFFKKTSKNIDIRIKEEIVPDLISKYELDINADNISGCMIFKRNQYAWITKNVQKNGGMLATYLSQALNEKLGKKKALWNEDDYKRATILLEEIYNYLDKVLESYLNL